MGNDDYSDVLNQRSQKFYSELNRLDTKQTINDNVNSLSEKIYLKVYLTRIKKDYSYNIRLFTINNGQTYPLNEVSDCINQSNNSVALNSRVIMRYFFEKNQPLSVEITRKKSNSTQTDQLHTTLGCIMGSRKNILQKNVSYSFGNEIVIIQAEKLRQSEDIIIIQFDIRPSQNVFFNDVKNKMYFEIYSDNLLYRSECINNLGKFNPVKIPLGFFHNNVINIKFCKNTRKAKGDFYVNIQELVNGKSFHIIINGTPFKIISKCRLSKNYTFVDYLKAGIQIGLSVAIDFTGSNGNPNEKTSLHYINDQEPNQYERAIFACGNIVAYYDYSQLFPCFGFGAKINNQPIQIFNLNFKQDPNIQYIQGIIDAYHNAIRIVQLWGPTNFAPIIRSVNQIIKNSNNNLKYHILMILTDGMIDDIDNTIEELVEGSFLPLSVIIIGVGNADFSNMVLLDADENPLINSRGVRAARDLVQFVPFLKYEKNPELLTDEVLAEIPRQLIEYYEQNNLDPFKLVN